MQDSLKESFLKDISEITSLNDLINLKAKYIGKKGIITEKIKNLAKLSLEERKSQGKILNELKQFIEELIKNKEEELKQKEISESLKKEFIDITLPGKNFYFGGQHPVNKTLLEIIDIFREIGFTVEEGPEVELDYYNFEALNIPKNHPARDMQDTFYVSEDVVLRTHTSPVQVRVMEKKKPPLRFISPGKVYRCDSDITHTPMFHQVEGLMVDEDVSFSHLKGILVYFLRRLFGENIPVRFRPSFFPFTEPSTEIDIGCIICSGSGCRVCKGTGWLEVLGAGMVHPNVFKFAGYPEGKYTGFAFGMGVERLTMLKYGIDDIRLFFENDIRFLRQF
ncbi:MAG: phenylalanine--tRNA ligase subunit alpha [Thermodesulfovibrio sp.]|uniref:phenylalanine--tRNA ligase subunit alpha n=1 Tax=Thermodesulfovibrio sp. 1176 TaxID=3043424 RepID=UPI0024830AD3|nr:phenylalanine--tRNA ligase subunit alpha [Thermodesulfovibrio sp. 1176]MDI1471468.1 phenylalanine--tRNA ligase subunit alpha [Thermodesulfovibrio sp. 1176]MDI6715042.1 phenylalanine--tRNA ligase subunit alpha [Thermodesulfovibrio sp.]